MPDPESSFTVTARGGAGLTYEQTRSKRYSTVTRGVRVTRPPQRPGSSQPNDLSLTDRCAAVQLVLGDQDCFTGATAARLLGIPIPRSLGDGQIEVASQLGSERMRRRGVRSVQAVLPAGHILERAGLRTTSPARTWFDLACRISAADLLAAGDYVLRHLATHAELASTVGWGQRRRGVTQARRMLPLLDARAESPGESRVRYWLLSGGIGGIECNRDIVEDGEWLARGDLVIRKARLIIEYDGQVHLPERQRRYDAARRNLLQYHGWQVIVVTARDLRYPGPLVALVREEIRRRT